MRLSKSSSGQAAPLVVLLVFMVLVVITATLWLGMGASARAKAQAVADAAALAGAGEGQAAAASTAQKNHAELTRYELVDGDVRVIVKFGKIAATARARNDAPPVDNSLGPAFRAAVARAEQISGQKVVVTTSTVDSIDVSPASANWLVPLSSQSGLCSSGPLTFKICVQ